MRFTAASAHSITVERGAQLRVSPMMIEGRTITSLRAGIIRRTLISPTILVKQYFTRCTAEAWGDCSSRTLQLVRREPQMLAVPS